MQQFMPNYVHNAIGVLAANKITQIRSTPLLSAIQQ